jgi:hypothetical protein
LWIQCKLWDTRPYTDMLLVTAHTTHNLITGEMAIYQQLSLS